MASAEVASRHAEPGEGARPAPAPAAHYFAFISYSHRDQRWADWLHKALETYRVPSRLVGTRTSAGEIPRRLLPIFRDRDELASSSDLGRTVNAALAQSRSLIVICSPAAAQSRWVNEEVLAFKRGGGSERIFCFIVDGEPNASELPGREAEECFAPALRHPVDADGRLAAERSEPVAADAREGRDGRGNAKLKLIAGLLDVGFDALKQRELQRRNRRLLLVTAAALLIMAITTGLAITAVIARHDAERRQKQAEDLVDFMLGDLNDKLREVNRLDILQAVDDKAMAYFASLPTKDVTDAALAQRVEALQKIGSVRQNRGNIPAALDAFGAASALAKELLARAPASAVRQADYANSLSWIGNARWYQGDLAGALRDFQEAVAILRKASAQRPQDSNLAYKLSSALTNTGRVLETRGDYSAAKPYYESVQGIFESLVAREPNKTRWRSELGDAFDNLGKLALEQGQLDGAIAGYRADQRIKAALYAHDTGNHEQQELLAISDAILGRTLAVGGEMKAAQRYLSEAVAALKAMLQFDPTQTEWQFLQARYGEQLGGVLRQDRQLDAAAEADRESLRLIEALAGKDPTNAEWQLELARSRIESARLQLERDDAAGTQTLVDAAHAVIEPARARAAADRNVTLLGAQADLIAGQVAAARGAASDARDHWQRARAAIAPVVQTGADLNFLASWATVLLLLDEPGAAQAVVARLAAAGCRPPDLVALAESKHLAYPANAALSQRIADILK